MSVPPPTHKQARILWFCITTLAVAAVLGLLALVVWGLGHLLRHLSVVLMPVLLALIIAYILDPVVEFFVRNKVPRLRAILLVMVMVLMILGGMIGAVIPGIVDETRKLVTDLPDNIKVMQGKLDDFTQHNRVGRMLAVSWRMEQSRIAQVAGTNVISTNAAVTMSNNLVGTNETGAFAGQTNAPDQDVDASGPGGPFFQPSAETVMPAVGRVVVSVVKWFSAQLGKVTTWLELLLGFVLVPLYLFYFLLEKQRIKRSWTDYLPIKESRAKEEMVFVLRAINDCLVVFFRGQVLVALCVGIMLGIGYLALGLNYAVLIGLVAAILEIVPYVGAIMCLIIALTVAAAQFGDWLHPLYVLGIAAVVKLIEDFIIFPRIMGKRSGLHPLTIILAVLIGANLLGGLIGALLAIPLTAVLRTLMFRYVWKRRENPIAPTKIEPGTG